jgi:hypothetical protein
MKNPATNTDFSKVEFNVPHQHLRLIKHWFSASTFVLKIATIANL